MLVVGKTGPELGLSFSCASATSLDFYITPSYTLESLLGFVFTSSYETAAKRIFTDDDQRRVELILSRDPLAGDVVAGTGGARKIRVGLSGRGKRGGARVLYYYVAKNGLIYLLHAYSKNQVEGVDAHFKSQLKHLIRIIDSEG